MDLAIPFKIYNDIWDEKATEFNLFFDPEHNSQEKMINFIEKYPDKRINIEFKKIDIGFASILNKITDKFYIRITDLPLIAETEILREKNIKFFFDYKVFPATNMYTLNYLLDLGVSDVYIAEDLCYNLPDISEIIHQRNVKIRLVLNTIPVTLPIREKEKQPYFPPGCDRILDQYIDTIEFDCGNPYNWRALKIYYEAWFEDRIWKGNLEEIIHNLDLIIPGDDLFVEELIKYKIQCRHKCLNQDSQCHRCQKFVELAYELDARDLTLDPNGLDLNNTEE